MCGECERVFAASSSKSRMCSDRCRKARKARYDRAYDVTVRPRADHHCADCGVLIGKARTKCDACCLITKRRRKERDKRRRRALKLGVPTEPYTLAEIAIRDRNRCGLCKKRVAMKQVVPHPRAPVIDHVLPLAADGDDTRANVQLAHFLCNSLKAAGGSQQLALVG